MAYVPEVGDTVTIELPDERTRAEIVRAISNATVIVRLTQYLTASSKSHSYKKGDLVPCRFVTGPMNQMMWKAVSEAELEDADESLPEEAAPVPEMVAADLGQVAPRRTHAAKR